MQTTVLGEKRVTTADVLKKPCEGLTVPVRQLEGVESLALGLRQHMLDMGDEGSVATGCGLNTDFIILKWGDKFAVLRGSEVLRAWVATFSPEDAARFPEEVAQLGD